MRTISLLFVLLALFAAPAESKVRAADAGAVVRRLSEGLTSSACESSREPNKNNKNKQINK